MYGSAAGMKVGGRRWSSKCMDLEVGGGAGDVWICWTD